MDQDTATHHDSESAPIFTAFRRGYDPEQVDRFVADQRRRLDDAQRRASEAERKLAAAVGQLRELHRRVTTLESEQRSTQAQAPAQPAQPLDTLGERVQRILQEAWEGAAALRQSAEQEIITARDQAVQQADELVATARRKAEAIEEEIERRRGAYLERIEEDRSRAVAQMTYLSEQRKLAVKELLRVKALIETTVNDITTKGEKAAAKLAETPSRITEDEDTAPNAVIEKDASSSSAPATDAPVAADDDLPKTMPVHRLPTTDWRVESETADLVRSHREQIRSTKPEPRVVGLSAALESRQTVNKPAVFDFEEQQPS
jgi:cell division septum initiation protein DivIVA